MMEKDLNELQPDKLIRTWTEESLAPGLDSRITESLMDFIDNDGTEIDVMDLLDIHIHELAQEEKIAKRRKWSILASSVAAAAVVVLVFTAISISKHQDGASTGSKALVVGNKAGDKSTVLIGESAEIITENANTIAKAAIKKETKVAYASKSKRTYAGKESEQTETKSEQSLIEAFAEINAGLVNMVDNTNECLRMTNVSLLPAAQYSDNNESNIADMTLDEYSYPQYNGQMQNINIIESNLINALYEIKTLNINLDFETDNKKTEI